MAAAFGPDAAAAGESARDDKYVAVTQDKRYVKLVPRIAVLSGIVRSMLKTREAEQ